MLTYVLRRRLFRFETREFEDKTLWSKARDIIRATFDRSIFQSWVRRLRESTWIGIEKPVKAVDNIAEHLGFSEEKKNQLLIYFSERIKYGLINAIARLVRDRKNVNEQIRLEEFGGRILASDTEFKELLSQRG